MTNFAPNALFDADAVKDGPTRRACTPETRKIILGKLENWALDTSSDSSPIFWLSGMAGTGKSTIAYTFCQHMKSKNLAASFFCSRNNENTRSPGFIVPTIVRQTLGMSMAFAQALQRVHLDDVVPSSPRHLKELLIQPWLNSLDWQPTPKRSLLIVIDALDEIEDNKGANFIEQLIGLVLAPGTKLLGLKFLLTSRPHPDIVKLCQSFEKDGSAYRLESMELKEAEQDLRHFVCIELPSLDAKLQERIIKESAGLFIYAATIIRYLCPPGVEIRARERAELLQKILPNTATERTVAKIPLVDTLYTTIIKEALAGIVQESIMIPKRLLCAIVSARNPLTPNILASLVVNSDEEANEDDMKENLRVVKHYIGKLHAVLYISNYNNCVYGFHKSLNDFILNPSNELSTLALTYFPARAKECIETMNSELRFNLCKLTSSYLNDDEDKGLQKRIRANIGPVLRYACQHWAAHMSSIHHIHQEHVQEMARTLLQFCGVKILFWMEAMNLLKLELRHAIHQVRTWALQVCCEPHVYLP